VLFDVKRILSHELGFDSGKQIGRHARTDAGDALIREDLGDRSPANLKVHTPTGIPRGFDGTDLPDEPELSDANVGDLETDRRLLKRREKERAP
jgi:hypothetical protein